MPYRMEEKGGRWRRGRGRRKEKRKGGRRKGRKRITEVAGRIYELNMWPSATNVQQNLVNMHIYLFFEGQTSHDAKIPYVKRSGDRDTLHSTLLTSA